MGIIVVSLLLPLGMTLGFWMLLDRAVPSPNFLVTAIPAAAAGAMAMFLLGGRWTARAVIILSLLVVGNVVAEEVFQVARFYRLHLVGDWEKLKLRGANPAENFAPAEPKDNHHRHDEQDDSVPPQTQAGEGEGPSEPAGQMDPAALAALMAAPADRRAEQAWPTWQEWKFAAERYYEPRRRSWIWLLGVCTVSIFGTFQAAQLVAARKENTRESTSTSRPASRGSTTSQ